jgi:RNA polymerase sigma-70 factor (ECF subfamily)
MDTPLHRRRRGVRWCWATDGREEHSAVKRALSPNALCGADELSVVICAMAGDDDAFGELVRRRQSSIRQLFRRLCRDPALADDLAQQTFLQAWRNVDTLKSPAAFGGWLRRLAINTWLQKVRAERTLMSTTDLDELPDQGAQPTVTEQLDLDSALATLPADVRLCIILAYAERMSHREICEAVGLPLGTVKSHITRGAARLRQLLGAYA